MTENEPMKRQGKIGETVKLTPEQMEAVRLADEAFERGESLTPEQVRELARKRLEQTCSD